MGKIAYITARTPFGKGEEFLIAEMLAFKKLGARLTIIPRNKGKGLFHSEGKDLVGHTILMPLIDFKIMNFFLKYVVVNPITIAKLLTEIVFKARNGRIALQNIAVLFKSLYIANFLVKESVFHIHAHWGTSTSTMAYIISKLTGIPWSLTVHSGDILENNLLKLKVSTAIFVRCISEYGKSLLLGIIGKEFENKISVLHMGLRCPDHIYVPSLRNNPFTIIVVAGLILIKGHKYMVDACSLLRERGIKSFRCIFCGEGYLRHKLQEYIKKKGLSDCIELVGFFPHEELINLYKKRKIDAAVLCSIKMKDGESEGIPVSLMEAMSYKIPVIATQTGGIPELIGDGSGIMVKERDAEAIANSIEKLIVDTDFYIELANKGRQKVEENFNVYTNVQRLLDCLKSNENHIRNEKDSCVG